MPDKIDAVVIGAGAIGLACARALALRGREVIILERNDDIGLETSSRSSEVIHAGIYYPSGSLKARLCVGGRRKLYEFCAAFSVGHLRCGKLIVATSQQQVDTLTTIRARAMINGVDDLQLLTAGQAQALEPALRCSAALFSPSTGIIDSRALMVALLGDAERHGASLALRCAVQSIHAESSGIVLDIENDAQSTQLKASLIVNATGHGAPALAASCRAMKSDLVPAAYLAKGNYFSLSGRPPFSRLIYPVPQPGGLGVHMTLDLGGQARFGPDVEWITSPDLTVDPNRAVGFYGAVRQYWPGLPDGSLQPAYAGIRPKITPPGAPEADFQIQGPAHHGINGLVNLFGIESPGLTSSLALGDYVAGLLGIHR
jgi:L-2-hydroxyglutarate oxidase LhgO